MKPKVTVCLASPLLGECLLDQPQKPLVLPDVLPGSTYSLDRQCELAFGEGSKPCPFMQPPCGRLWCTGKSNGHLVCMTRHFPWADGTHCGDGQVCDRGVCSDKQAKNAKVRLTKFPVVNIDLNWGVIKKGLCCYCRPFIKMGDMSPSVQRWSQNIPSTVAASWSCVVICS